MKTRFFVLCAFLLALTGCGTTQDQQLETTEISEKTETKQETKQEFVEHHTEEERGRNVGGIDVIPLSYKVQNHLESSNMFDKDIDAGKFSNLIIVGFGFLNETNEEIMIRESDLPKVIDSKGRQYSPYQCGLTCELYVPLGFQNKTLKPGIPTIVGSVYEVAKDSTGLYFSVDMSGVEHRDFLDLLEE